MRSRVLVTGASGFIGRTLVRVLVESGHQVRCLVRASSRREPLECLGVEFDVGDMTDPASLREPVASADVVYHLASLLKVPWRRDFLSTNAGGTGNLAAACAEAEQPPVLVVVSSLAAAGPSPNGQPRREDQPPAPVSIYGRVKLASESAAVAHADLVPISIVRPPMVFGDADRSTLKLFRSAAAGWHPVPGLRDHHTSLVHAEDLSRALVAVAERGERVEAGASPDAGGGKGIYHAAFSELPTWADLGRLVAQAVGRRRVRVVRVPAPLLWGVAAVSETAARWRDQPTLLSLDKMREACAGSWTCDVSKSSEQLGWQPAASLLERLGQTAAWYRAEGWLS